MSNFGFFKDRAKHYMEMFEIRHLWDVSFEEKAWDDFIDEFIEETYDPFDEEFDSDNAPVPFARVKYLMKPVTFEPLPKVTIQYNSDETLNEMLTGKDIDYLAMHEVLHLVFAGVFYPDIDKEHKIIDALMYGMSMPIEGKYTNQESANGIMQTIWTHTQGIVQKVERQRSRIVVGCFEFYEEMVKRRLKSVMAKKMFAISPSIAAKQ